MIKTWFAILLTHVAFSLFNCHAYAYDVTTFHNNNYRTGANLDEAALTTSNVRPNTFGKLFAVDLDGNSFGQPLYVRNVSTSAGAKSLVFVATSKNSVYAIDAINGGVAWQRNFGAPIPGMDVSAFRDAHMTYYFPYYDIYPTIGITSTPVIDLASKTIFIVAKVKEQYADHETYKYELHALDISTGNERSSSPVSIDGQVTINPSSATELATIKFDPFLNLNRAGLLYLKGHVLVAFASQGDVEDSAHRPFHGWIFSYDSANLQNPPAVFCTSPTSQHAGIWQSGGGLAADTEDNLYAVTGNGPNVSGSFGNSVLRFSTKSGLDLKGWFTPDNSEFLNRWDLDLGSGGPVLPPDETSKDAVLVGGKEGVFYVVSRSALLSGKAGPNAVHGSLRLTPEPKPIPQKKGLVIAVKELLLGYERPPVYHGANDWHHLHGTPVYWNGPLGATVYLWPEMEKLKVISLSGSKLIGVKEAANRAAGGMPGAALSLSANGNQAGTAILWASRPLSEDANRRNVEGILEAYDAVNIGDAKPIWSNRDVLDRDGGGFFAKFSPPTVADGRVYLSAFAPEKADRTPVFGKSAQLIVYGLLE